VKFCIKIQETLSRKVVVEADSYAHAFLKVEKAYTSEEIILNADDFTSVSYIKGKLDK